jgi:hypothetical protein
VSGLTARISFALVASAAAAFAVLLARAPARFMGVDDAYYLGIGSNLLAGRGPISAFGSFPAQHSVLWPVLISAPHAWLGIDPSAWAHALVIASGAAVIALTGWFAGRCMRLAAPLAAACMLAFPFMLGLATGLGLDLPAAAATLSYLALGLTAVRRGSVAWGVAAGAMFAFAFLVKEIALPFAPVPLFAGLVRGLPIASLIRVISAIALTGLAGTSWWFVLHAQQLGTVYRLGAPAWTLVPIAVVAVVVSVLGLAAGGRSRRVLGWNATGLAGTRVGWVGALLWAVCLTVFFARTPTGLGTSFLNPAQVSLNLSSWVPELGLVLAVGLVGGAIAVATRVRHRRSEGSGPNGGSGAEDGELLDLQDPHAIDDLVVATLCGLPLILLVVSVGEGPRHYIVQIGLLVALGASGWLEAAIRVARGRDRTTLVAAALSLVAAALIVMPFVAQTASRALIVRMGELAGAAGLFSLLVWRGRLAPRLGLPFGAALAAIALSAATAGGVVLALYVVPRSPSVLDATRAEAVGTIDAWLRANVQEGSTVGFGAQLAFETALPLQGRYRTVQVRDDPGIHVDPSAPLGVRHGAAAGATDWISLRASPTDVTSLYGYRAEPVAARLQQLGVTIWIVTELAGTSNSSSIVEALRHTTGAATVAHWEWPYGAAHLETTAFRLEPHQLAFSDRVYVSRDALERITSGLERDPSAARAAAAALAARAVVTPDDAVAATILERLRRLAAQ